MAEWVTRRYTHVTVNVWERRGNNADGSPHYVRVQQTELRVSRVNETEIRGKLRRMGFNFTACDISWEVHGTHVYGMKEADFLANADEAHRAANGTVTPI